MLRHPHGRGRQRGRRRVQDQRGPAGAVPGPGPRPRPICENGFTNVALGMSLIGPAPDRRVHVRGLHAHRRRRDRQPAAQVPLHVRRAVLGAGDAPRHQRRRRPLRHPAQRHRRELVHVPAGHAHRARRARPAPRTSCCGAAIGDNEPGPRPRAQGALRPQGSRRARRGRRDRQGRRAPARGPTSPSSPR